MNIPALIFESYNLAVEESFNKIFAENRDQDFLALKGKALNRYLRIELETWENTNLQEADGITPKDYFNGIDNFNELIECFRLGAKLCVHDIPNALLKRLYEFDAIAFDELLLITGEKPNSDDEDDAIIPVMAVKALGMWKTERSAGSLVKILYSCDKTDDLYHEAVRDSLVLIGTPAFPVLLDALDNADIIGYVEEYLLMALSEAGKNFRNDEVFKCLKKTFYRMNDKRIGAACLGDYGDGRAITALRGYIEKSGNLLDKESFYDILSVISRLGGLVEDLTHKNN